jgi:2-phosphosulfolactate phosphatase
MNRIEVLFAPAEFTALAQRNLRQATCVVFDVLRASTSMVTALQNGARAILPVTTIEEALAVRNEMPEAVLAGERDGVRILAGNLSRLDFDLGNSPREFTRDRVAGRTIVMTTTNGTRALRACVGASTVLAGSFLNLSAVARFLLREAREELIVVCSGTFEEAALEDALAAGALCDAVWERVRGGHTADSAVMARRLFLASRDDLASAVSQAHNAQRLNRRPELREDVPFCLRRDTVELVAQMEPDGSVRPTPERTESADLGL